MSKNGKRFSEKFKADEIFLKYHYYDNACAEVFEYDQM